MDGMFNKNPLNYLNKKCRAHLQEDAPTAAVGVALRSRVAPQRCSLS